MAPCLLACLLFQWDGYPVTFSAGQPFSPPKERPRGAHCGLACPFCIVSLLSSRWEARIPMQGPRRRGRHGPVLAVIFSRSCDPVIQAVGPPGGERRPESWTSRSAPMCEHTLSRGGSRCSPRQNGVLKPNDSRYGRGRRPSSFQVGAVRLGQSSPPSHASHPCPAPKRPASRRPFPHGTGPRSPAVHVRQSQSSPCAVSGTREDQIPRPAIIRFSKGAGPGA